MEYKNDGDARLSSDTVYLFAYINYNQPVSVNLIYSYLWMNF